MFNYILFINNACHFVSHNITFVFFSILVFVYKYMLFRVFADFVTDFDFSPFDDYLLSTCSQDGTVSMCVF